MIEHVWSVLCQDGAIDAQTNHVSIFNALETLVIFGDPQVINRISIHFEIISSWVRSDEKLASTGMMRLYFCNPEGECNKQLDFPIDLSKSMFHHTRINSSCLMLKGPGRYKFMIDLQEEGGTWKPVATLPLIITFETPGKQP